MEKIKLSEWAEANGKTYKQSWSMVKDGTFPGKIEETKTGRIMVLQEAKALANKPTEVSFATPIFSDLPTKESKASVRRNRAADVQRTDEYYHIENGVNPFQMGDRTKNSGGNDSVSPNDAIRLCQLAYFNFSDFRNTIDVMTEFSTNNIYLRGGNAKSRDFVDKWMKKFGILNFQDRFFREYYRSGNDVIIRFEAILKDEDLNTLNKIYGTKALKEVKLPFKYVILNPVNVIAGGNISFANNQFFQRLTPYEVQRLKKPITEEDKNFYNSLSPEFQKIVANSSTGTQIDIPLNPDYSTIIFYKKQDYEPMAIPMGFPVLKDLNWKAEMKHIDMAVARTTQQVILLITMGYESKNGEYMVDPKVIAATQQLFSSESVGKTLVADFTTKAQFIIPDISNILDPKKYQQVNEDIKTGLNNILVGSSEKFANQSIKVKLFIQRLQQSREVFLNEFLIPEIKRICKDMGFKNYPTPYFEDLDLKDEDLFNRIVAQLGQMGILTAWEVTRAMETGVLPDKEESIEGQREYKKYKDEGLYQAVQANPAPQLEVLSEQGKQQEKIQTKQLEHDDKQKTKDRKHAAENPQQQAPQIVLNAPTKMAQPNGRPAGSKSPKTVKKPAKPSKASEQLYSLSKIKDNLILAMEISKEVKNKLCDKFKLKELNEEQTSLAETLVENIITNEVPEKWHECVADYLAKPDSGNDERFQQVLEIGQEHQIDDFLAGILLASKKENA